MSDDAPAIQTFAPDDDPLYQTYRDGDVDREAQAVLLWVQRAQRAEANHAANLAVDIAKHLDVPVIAIFCLVPAFPEATLRAYHFMAEGLAELPDAFAKRNIGWVLETGEPAEVIPRRAHTHRAAAVITDVNPLRIGREWRDAVAQAVEVPMVAVDTDVVVPSALFENEEYAPRTLRPKIHKHLERYLVRIPDPHAPVASEVREGPDPMTAIGELGLDTSVGPAPDMHGGAKEGRKRLRAFVNERLARYHTDRNRAEQEDGWGPGSGLSPWLHYGQIGPTQVAWAVAEADDVPDGAREAFYDELIVQRELAVNFALRNADYDRYAGLPDWGRETLAKHADDPRPEQYTRAELEAAETDDVLWNAAMTQMIYEGFLPNRLRLYWGKQILRWSPSGESAWETAIYLNNRYFVDGRDANSYANVSWCIGGRHDRPFGPEKEIIGLVRPMGMGAMKRTFDVNAYIAQIHERWGVPGPEDASSNDTP